MNENILNEESHLLVEEERGNEDEYGLLVQIWNSFLLGSAATRRKAENALSKNWWARERRGRFPLIFVHMLSTLSLSHSCQCQL